MNNISLLLLTKNEQDNLKGWSDWIHQLTAINEIVVVDDESTDSTVKILKSFFTKELSINIFKKKLENNFSDQRNFGLKKREKKKADTGTGGIPNGVLPETNNWGFV